MGNIQIKIVKILNFIEKNIYPQTSLTEIKNKDQLFNKYYLLNKYNNLNKKEIYYNYKPILEQIQYIE